MNNEELLAEIETTASEMKAALSRFSESEFNTIPFEDSWTPGQLAGHLNLALMPDVLYGTTEPTTTRAPDAGCAGIREMFGNMDHKMKSPAFLRPGNISYDKATVLAQIDARWDAIKQAASTLDLTVTCTSFVIPGAGPMTRMEWLCLCISHSQRHTIQANNMYEKMKAARIGSYKRIR